MKTKQSKEHSRKHPYKHLTSLVWDVVRKNSVDSPSNNCYYEFTVPVIVECYPSILAPLTSRFNQICHIAVENGDQYHQLCGGDFLVRARHKEVYELANYYNMGNHNPLPTSIPQWKEEGVLQITKHVFDVPQYRLKKQ